MAKKETVLDLPVAFKSVSFGDKTARLGVSVARECLKVNQADKGLCDKRLTGTIESTDSENDGQGRLDGMDTTLRLTGIFDVKGFRVDSNQIGFGLTFSLKDLDRAVLSEFAKRSGRLIVEGAEAIPDDAEDDPDEEPAEFVPPVLDGDDAWRAVPIGEALAGLPKNCHKAFAKAEIKTMGDFADFQGKHGDFWVNDLEGVGPGMAEKISDAAIKFWERMKTKKAE